MFQAPSPARQRVPVRTCTRVLRFGGAVVCRPYGTRGLRDTGVPTTEVVGYSLSSLTGLNLGAAQIPFSFVPDGTRGLGDTGVPTTEVVGYYLPSLTGLNA